MATQQQIDIEFDSLAHGDDSPKLIANSKATGGTLLSVIEEQLSTCSSFDFCVAFIADGGLQILVEAFQELKQRDIKGRLLTSTYLNFNSPDVFRKLLEYDNIEVRVFEGNLHAKGYIFDKGETSTVIVGSSNMTQAALTCNKEWNVLYQTVENSQLLGELRGEFNSLWNDASTITLSHNWIDSYAKYPRFAGLGNRYGQNLPVGVRRPGNQTPTRPLSCTPPTHYRCLPHELRATLGQRL